MLHGVCVDAEGANYDTWSHFGLTDSYGNGGKGLSAADCQTVCEASEFCVGVQYSSFGDRCVLRVAEHLEITESEYE